MGGEWHLGHMHCNELPQCCRKSFLVQKWIIGNMNNDVNQSLSEIDKCTRG